MTNDTAVLNLLDVTLRDGGYLNEHSWRVEDGVQVVTATEAAGIPFTEVGYLRPAAAVADADVRPAACCPPHYLRMLAERASRTRLVVMAKPHECLSDDVRRLPDEGVEMLRMPVTEKQIGTAAGLVGVAKQVGLTVSVNLIRASELAVDDLVGLAVRAQDAGADVVYFADSNGSLFPAEVGRIATALRAATQIPIGFHAHDNLRLAFANALTAAAAGCTYLDASVGGLGKGGGNLRTELIAAYLQHNGVEGLRANELTTLRHAMLRERTALETGAFDAIVTGLLDLNLDEIARAHAVGVVSIGNLLAAPRPSSTADSLPRRLPTA